MHAIPESMQFIGSEHPGSPDVLRVETGPVPRPRDGEVLVRVAAASVNRPDVLQREGKYPPPPGVAALPPGSRLARKSANVRRANASSHR